MKEIIIIGRSSEKTEATKRIEELIIEIGFSKEEIEAACHALCASFQSVTASMKALTELAAKTQNTLINKEKSISLSVNPYERKYRNIRNRR